MKTFLSAFIAACLLLTTSAYGQDELPKKARKIFLKAEHHYHHFAYFAAIDYYKQYLGYDRGHHESMLKIADSYYKVKDYDQTLAWYDSAVLTGNIPPEHEFQYADVLMNHGKQEKAKEWLRKYLENRPDDKRAREKLEGLENTTIFFIDSGLYRIFNVPINSKFSDFSPVHYSDGFVFVSARGESKSKKKIDRRSNGAYLDLYYTAVNDTAMTPPERLSIAINSRFHEGPLALYDSGRQMIFTRNDYVKKKSATGGSNTVHFQMFHTQKNNKNEWADPKLLSIHDKQYSMGHPSVTKDGSTLYFASNLPGGHGGSDIYKSTWENNTWGTPQNLGAGINTEGNEMFPYIFNDSILYFSSDGFKGLGGLDIFKSNLKHPGEVFNIGYPVNSNKDDFGILLSEDGSRGYFSSNREGGIGNDDIYKFTAREKQRLAARVFKESDQSPLAGAMVKVLSFIVPDQELTANENGVANFYLPQEDAFVIIGTKDGFIGMYTGLVEKDDVAIMYPVSANDNHANQLPVVGRITNKRGEPLSQAAVSITDKRSGKKIPSQFKEGILSFFGEKGKEYTITVEDSNYQPVSKDIGIPINADEVEKISIILDDKFTRMAVRVFKETDQLPLSGANVRIISFAEHDIEVTANEQGIADFNLPDGAAYVVIGNKDGFTGMHSGIVAEGEDYASIIHPVPANNDPAKQLPVIGLVVDEKGEPMASAEVIVLDINTQKSIPVKIENGILYFFGEKGSNYKVQVIAQNYDSLVKNIEINLAASSVTPVEFNMLPSRPVEIYYTIQILALKSSLLVRKGFLQELKGVRMHDGKDGFHRYTYGEYKGFTEANATLKTIREMGYSDAFIRRMERYAELSKSPGQEVDLLYRQMGRIQD